jgi:hypothetical protein
MCKKWHEDWYQEVSNVDQFIHGGGTGLIEMEVPKLKKKWPL